MEIDIGFDLFPPLAENEHNDVIWATFIAEIERTFAGDSRVVTNANGVEFNVGEHPKLPSKYHRFRRFSSKVSGRSEAEPYIRRVLAIAKSCILAVGCISGPSSQTSQELSTPDSRFMRLKREPSRFQRLHNIQPAM